MHACAKYMYVCMHVVISYVCEWCVYVVVIGASLSEPHTSELNDAIFVYIYYMLYVFRMSV